MPDLLPCPCGCRAVESWKLGDGTWCVECLDAECAFAVLAPTREKARAGWNALPREDSSRG